MVERQEVEALLADATHPHSYMERVPADTLAALCRAWLAVRDSPEVVIGGADGLSAFLISPGDHSLRCMSGQRVRIVKEVG